MTLETLKTARENLPGHWHQGEYTDNAGNYCALGHLANVEGMISKNGEVYSRYDQDIASRPLAQVIGEQYPDWIEKTYGSYCNLEDQDFLDAAVVAEWNDVPGRTEEEVIAIFDKAIARAEEML